MSFVNTPQWAAVLKRLIRAEMALRDVTYDELSVRLKTRYGTVQTANNLKVKINKGILGGQLLLQIFSVLGAEAISISRAREIYATVNKVNSKPGN